MRIHNPSITGSFTVTGSKLNIDADGNITSLGSVTANQYIVSSSVTNISIATNSGSTAFGDTADDTHVFIGNTISGSSTSTGSFGSLVVSDKVQGNINFGGTENIFRTTTANQYTRVRIDQGTAQYQAKLHFGGLLAANADYLIGEIAGIWNYDVSPNPVAAIRFETGDDTTNRDDGRITFWTSEASRTLTERMRIQPSGDIKIGGQGQLLLVNQGTQAAPAIAFDPDTNTGIYQNTDNELDISINNNTIVNMDTYNFNIQSAAGLNVGISDDVKFKVSYLGHASGSATSTGSFGSVFGLTGGGKFGIISVGPKNAEATIRSDSSDLYLQYNAGASRKVRIGHSSQTIIDDTIISGSSTSTGSFGRINLADSNPVIGNNGIIVKGGSGSTGVNFRVRNGSGNEGFRVHGYGNLAIGGAFGDTGATTLHIRYIAGGLLNTGTGINEYIRLEDNSNKSGSIGLGSNGNLQLLSQGGTTSVKANSGGVGNLTVDGKVHIGSTGTPAEALVVVGNVSASADSTGSFGAGYIDNKLGIGTSSPTEKLSISSGNLSIDSNYFLKFGTDNNRITGNNDALFFQTAAVTRLKLDDNSHISLSNNDLGTSNTVFGKSMGTIDAGTNYNTFIGEGIIGAGGISDATENTALGWYSLRSLTTGDINVSIGSTAMEKNTTGGGNVGIGVMGLRYNVTGVNNTAIGTYSQKGVSGNSHSNNTSVGANSLFSITTGDNNVALGIYSLYEGTTFTNNVAIGDRAGFATTGNDNVLIGSSAGYYSYVATDSVIIGHDAGYYATGSYNTFVGSNAGKGGTTSAPYSSGTHNVAVGYEALRAFTTATRMVAIGYEAMTDVTTGADSVAIGYQAAYYDVGINSVSIGAYAGMANGGGYNVNIGFRAGTTTTGDSNVAIGNDAMRYLNAGNQNVAIGNTAGSYLLGTQTAIVGSQAGRFASGSYNTFMGYYAGRGGTTSAPYSSGEKNTAVGYKALNAFTTGLQNTAIGYEAGMSLTTTEGNTAIGYQSMRAATSAGGNIAIGKQSLASLATGAYNIAIGQEALLGADGAENNNVAIGPGSMGNVNNDSSEQNIMIGRAAGLGGTGELDRNVAIGTYAMDGTGTVAGQQNIFIGDNTGGGSWTTAASNSNVAIGATAMSAALNGALGNTAVGHDTLKAVTTGDYNVAVGHQAGDAITTGAGNVAIGRSALSSEDTNGGNVAVGRFAGVNNKATGNIYVGYNTGYYNVSGIENVIIGYESAAQTVGNVNFRNVTTLGSNAGRYATGSYNTFIGSYAGVGGQTSAPLSSGQNNVAVGHEALTAFTTAAGVTAVGYQTLTALTTGIGNSGLGDRTLKLLTTGQYNTALGNQAMENTVDGNRNIAIGYQAGSYVLNDYNTAVGFNAGKTMSGSHNTFVGNEAGLGGGGTSAPHSSGQYNTSVGSEALKGTTTANYNVAIGYQAGTVVTTGGNNVFLGGYRAGYANTSGNNNIMIGYSAGQSNVSGDEMVLIGTGAGAALNHDTDNDGAVFIGYNAGTNYVSGGGGGVFIGWKAGQMADAASTNAVENVYVGYEAGRFLDDGTNNVALGQKAMRSIDADGHNAAHSVAIGFETLYGITDGDSNIAIGSSALKTHTTGHSNIAIGKGAMDDTDAGSNSLDSDNNVFIGNSAGGGTWTDAKSEYNTVVGNSAFVSALEAAVYNTGLGYRAGESLTTADSCVIIGGIAGANITSGLRNVVIGYNAATTLTSGDYNIYIGSDANASGADVNDEILLAAGTGTLAGGGTETISIGVDSDYITNDFGENATWTHSSDRRVKKDIKDTNIGLDFILKLQPKEFKKKAPSEYPTEFEQYNVETTKRKNPDRVHYGFVAQEVKEAMDSVGHSEFPVWKENRDGMQELGETELITPLVKAVQELSSENQRLKDKLNDLEIFIMDKLGDDK